MRFACQHTRSKGRFLLRLRSFLQSANEVMKGLTVPGDNPEFTQRLVTGCEETSRGVVGCPPAVRDFVRKVVRRIVVEADKMDLEMSRTELRGSITDNPTDASSSIAAGRKRARMTSFVLVSK